MLKIDCANSGNDKLAFLNFSEVGLGQRFRIQRDLNSVYLNNPKAACTSIKRYLWAAAGGDEVSFTNKRQFLTEYEGSFEQWKREKHSPLFENGDVLVFSVVRNPYARIWSAWYDKVFLAGRSKKGRVIGQVVDRFGRFAEVGFVEFLKWLLSMPDDKRNSHFRTQTSNVLFDYLPVDFYGCVEDITSTFDRLGSVFGCRSVTDNLNSTNSFAAFSLDEEAVRLVREIYASDFSNFGYSTEIDDVSEVPLVASSVKA